MDSEKNEKYRQFSTKSCLYNCHNKYMMAAGLRVTKK